MSQIKKITEEVENDILQWLLKQIEKADVILNW